MSVRPFRDIIRRKTKVINVGDVKIRGDNPISVQSITNTLTTDVKATINQMNNISEEGAELAAEAKLLFIMDDCLLRKHREFN